LPAGTHSIIGGKPIYDLTLTVNGAVVSDLGGKSMRVSLAYELQPGENSNRVVVYYISESGQLELVKHAKWLAQSGKVTFAATHFSQYAAVHRAVSFTDLTHVPWARESIEALAARDMVSGIGNGLFAPGSKVTRAQFITMLMNAFAFTAESKPASTFTDVSADAWYSNAIALAQKLGIVYGKPDGSFGVNDEITREEMAVIAYRASKLAQLAIGGEKAAKPFADQAAIAGYALESVAAMQQAGIINGKGADRFAPKDHATRAEAAKIIYALFQLMP
jgi:hypothetical protein